MTVRFNAADYRKAILFLEVFLLDVKGKPLSRAGARHRLAKMPQCFLPIGDGVHLLPITMSGFPIGFSTPIPPQKMILLKDRWIPAGAMDWDYLLPGGLLFGNVERLLAQSPEGRRELALRAYAVFRRMGFSRPKMPRGTWARIGAMLDRQKDQCCKLGDDDQ